MSESENLGTMAHQRWELADWQKFKFILDRDKGQPCNNDRPLLKVQFTGA